MAKINNFGTLVDLPKVNFDSSIFVDQIVKKHKERGVFNEFLQSELKECTVHEHLSKRAKEQAKVSQDMPARGEVIEAVIRRYKQVKLNGHSAYDELVFSIIQTENNNSEIIKKIKKGKIFQEDLPDNFPGQRKKAEVLLKAKIQEDLKESDIKQLQSEKNYLSLLRFYSRDLFFAINNGLGEKSIDLLQIMFFLDEIQSSEPMARDSVRRLIARGLKGEVVDIVHIKSLRFTYPGGSKLVILEDLEGIEQEGVANEQRAYPSEKVIFSRLNDLRNTLANYGITTNLTVLVSDHDLNYCFPQGQTMVSEVDIEKASLSASNYVKSLKDYLLSAVKVYSLSEFLEVNDINGKFLSLFSDLVREGECGGGSNVGEKMLVARTDEQFDHYREMFGSYTRYLARTTAIKQIANALALSEVFKVFPTTPLLVIDTRGFENKLIGGYNPESVVKYFTKLKDPVKITKE